MTYEIIQMLEVVKVNCKLWNTHLLTCDTHELSDELKQEIYKLNQDIGALGLKCMMLEQKIKYDEMRGDEK